MNVRTRIAPSPTGIAHIGTAYYAIYNYAVAKKNNGKFIVRIEDTDRARFVEGAEQVIYDALEWLHIPYDEAPTIGGPHAPYRQSERLPLYKKYAEELIENGHAYYCFCSPERLDTMRKDQQARGEVPHYDRLCRSLSPEESKKRVDSGEKHVVRMMIPENEVISWEDLIRGHVEFKSGDVDEQVILKSDGFPTYHLAVVVDDHEMEISHVLRGEDWISSTPKHVLLYRYFGWELPLIGHMPLLRNTDKSKMSKRKNDVSVFSYKDKGYLPQALRNYLCLMGWSHPEEKDIFSMDEYVDVFTLERMQKTGPIFDVNKLNWINGKYIREVISTDELMSELTPFLPSDFPKDLLPNVLPLIRDRLVTLKDIEPLTEFFYRDIVQSKEEMIGKKGTIEDARMYIDATIEVLSTIEEWEALSMETKVRDMCDGKEWSRGSFFMTLRVAVTGRSVTPPLFDTIAVLGKETTLARLTTARAILEK